MISRAVHMIFEEVTALRLKGWSFGVAVSHLEIYNENLRDLLAEAGAEPRKLEIKHVDGGRMAAVTNLEVVPVDSAEAVEVGACGMRPVSFGHNHAPAFTHNQGTCLVPGEG